MKTLLPTRILCKWEPLWEAYLTPIEKKELDVRSRYLMKEELGHTSLPWLFAQGQSASVLPAQ